jgi:solute carrier family 8 (sodium/calcium exchanger)
MGRWHAQVQFAFIPPKQWRNGVVAFAVSIGFICFWSAIMGEMAKLFGCSVGLTDAQTAIAFVSVGTSLPGLFVSRLSVVHDLDANPALENMTGSNSVNVFVGLGIPWLIGSLYHGYAPAGKGEYRVPAGSLGFSLGIFFGVAVIAVLFQMVRRWVHGADFGGQSKAASNAGALFLTVVWMVYVLVACTF